MKQSKKESTGVKNQEELNKKQDSYKMTVEEQASYNFYIERFKKAKEQQDQAREEFDDQTYANDYLSNQRAMVSYLKKKKNDSDVRIVTGTTEKRIETVLNELMAMNLQPEVRSFDQNDIELAELGDHFSDLVKRTNEIEDDEDKKLDFYIELISQRAVFVEEIYIERKTRNGSRFIRRCEKRMVPGLQILLGDITLPAHRFNEQPYRLKYKRISYDEAKSIYDYDNFSYVKPGNFAGEVDNNPYYYRMNDLSANEVEVIEYVSVLDDEYQIMINGVLMLPVGSKIPWDWDGDNITMVVLKPIHPLFAYGKPLTASAKTLQALNDESVRNVVRKWRQSVEPPMGTKSGKVYSKDIWNPGSMTQGLSDKDFSILNPSNNGLSSSDTAMLQFIEQKTNEFIGTSVLMSSPTKRMTATETIQQQKQAVKMLGLAVLSAMRLIRNLTYLRIYNIIENEVKPIKREFNTYINQTEAIYRAFTINDAKISGNKKGKKIIGFSDRPINRQEEEAIYKKEKESEKKGDILQYKIINIKKLREIRPNWYVVVTNKERDSSELSKAMFTEKLAQATSIMNVTGKRLNGDAVVESFERTWQDKNLFEKSIAEMGGAEGELMQRIESLKGGGMGAGQLNESLNKGMTQGITEGAKEGPLKPTVNTMLGAN